MLEPVTADEQLRRAYGCFASGVAAVCAEIDGRPVGLVASSFTSVSLRPPLVAINVRHESTTWPLLRTGRRLGLSLLAEGQEDMCRRLAGTADHRFSRTAWRATDNGCVVIDGATSWFDCSVHAEIPAGDHDVVLLLVHGLPATEDDLAETVHIVSANAGVVGTPTAAEPRPEDGWQTMIDINLSGVWHPVTATVPHLKTGTAARSSSPVRWPEHAATREWRSPSRPSPGSSG